METAVVKGMPGADEVRLEEERCSALKATSDLFGEALALQCVLTRSLCRDDKSEEAELQDLLTEVAGLECRLKTDEDR